MNNVPDYIEKELEKLSSKQRMKFNELLAWSGNSGFPGATLNFDMFEKVLGMVKRMGEEPIEPVGPSDMPNHDMEFNKHIGKWYLKKK